MARPIPEFAPVAYADLRIGTRFRTADFNPAGRRNVVHRRCPGPSTPNRRIPGSYVDPKGRIVLKQLQEHPGWLAQQRRSRPEDGSLSVIIAGLSPALEVVP